MQPAIERKKRQTKKKKPQQTNTFLYFKYYNINSIIRYIRHHSFDVVINPRKKIECHDLKSENMPLERSIKINKSFYFIILNEMHPRSSDRYIRSLSLLRRMIIYNQHTIFFFLPILPFVIQIRLHCRWCIYRRSDHN